MPEQQKKGLVIRDLGDSVDVGGITVPKKQIYAATATLPRREIYEATATGSISEAQSVAITDLKRVVKELDDAQVYVWSNDDEPIGPRLSRATGLDVSQVPETTLRALLFYEYERRERAWEQQQQEEKEKRERRRYRITLVVTILLGLGGWVVAFLN